MSKRKKFVATSVVAALTATSVVAVSANEATSFPDVVANSSHAEAIQILKDRQVISGYPDGTFKPGIAVTRGQAAKMIVNMFGIEKGDISKSFKDVPVTSEYYEAISILASIGAISGYDNGNFEPQKPITRAQMAKILAVALELAEQSTTQFTDVGQNSSFNGYIGALANLKITTGDSTGKKYLPLNAVTRAQLASFLVRAEKVLKLNFNLSILHVNDMHARVEEYPKLYSAVKEQRQQKPNVLLLNAGDVFSGTLYFNEFEGEADSKLLNLMKFDAMTFGNHEFDLGSSPNGHASLVKFIKDATYPFVAANIDFSGDARFNGLFTDLVSSQPENGKIYSGIVKEYNGEKIGIFGLTTEETADIAFVGSVKFENYIAEAKKAVAAFENMGVNKIIALTHIGYDDNPNIDNDLQLAKYVDGIDVIVGGHTHTELKQPVEIISETTKEPTIIVQAKEYTGHLGTIDVTFNKAGVVTKYNGELISLSAYEADKEAAAILKDYKARVDEVMSAPTKIVLEKELINPRSSETSTLSVRANETALGNIVTDGMRAKAQAYAKDKKVVMALQNGGGIRAPLATGPVTIGQAISVLPFGNTLALMDATGEEIYAAFEVSVKNAPAENGGFLHVSGAKVVYDSSKPVGQRVVSIHLVDADGKETALSKAATYTIATNAFTAKGGDGFDMFAKAYADGRVTELGLSDWENFVEHLESLKTIKYEAEGRIVDLAAK